MKYYKFEKQRDEEIEAKRNANMRLMFYSSVIFLCTIIFTITLHLLGFDLDRQVALNICYIGITIVVVSFIAAYLKRNESFLIATIGLCIILIVASFGQNQVFPVVSAMVCGFIIPFTVYLMMKYRYAEKLNESVFENVKGGWEIDEHGYVRKTDYPIYWPEPSELEYNIYGLWIIPPLGSKKKIGHIGINILKCRPRVPEHEKKLIPYIKSTIKEEYDYETIEKNGGLDKIVKDIYWEELKRPRNRKS